MFIATFAWGDTTDQLGTIVQRLLRMKGALLPCEALADHLGVLVDENAHV